MARHSSATTREEASTPRKEESTPRKQQSTAGRETSTRDETSRRHNEKSDNSTRAGGHACGPSSDSSLESYGINASLKPHSIDASLKRRARLLISNSSIPRQTRSLIRYALEIKDPHLDQVVRRVEAGEMTIEWLYVE